nr:hypothetical protein [Tanacetum cinerariifolium]
MGLDDVFSNVRSSILITKPLPDVKYAFATLCIDESHKVKNVHFVVNKSSSSSAFLSKSNNEWSANKFNQNNYIRRFNRGHNPNLVCKHCIMTGHTIDRCFELLAYPTWYKKNYKDNNSKATFNKVTACSSSSTYMLTGNEYQKLIVYYFASCRLFNMNTNISTYSTYVGWIIDSRTVAKVSQIGSFKLTKTLVIHDVLVVSMYHDSTKKSVVGTSSMIDGLYFLDQGKKHINSNVKICVVSKCLWHNRDVKFYETVYPFRNQSLTKDFVMELNDVNNLNSFDNQMTNEPCDDVRDNITKDDGIMPCYEVNIESNDIFAVVDDSANHPASTRDKTVHDSSIFDNIENINSLGSITIDGVLKQDDETSDDENYKYTGEEFGKFDLLFGLDEGDPKRVVDETVRRSNRKTSFLVDLRIMSCKGKLKALTNSKWVEDMNNEMDALNGNNTWEITDLLKQRKHVGCKWIFKVKYKSNGEVERYKARLVAKGERIPKKDKIRSKPDKNRKRGEAGKSQKQLQLKITRKRIKSDQNRTKTGSVAKPGKG